MPRADVETASRTGVNINPAVESKRNMARSIWTESVKPAILSENEGLMPVIPLSLGLIVFLLFNEETP